VTSISVALGIGRGSNQGALIGALARRGEGSGVTDGVELVDETCCWRAEGNRPRRVEEMVREGRIGR